MNNVPERYGENVMRMQSLLQQPLRAAQNVEGLEKLDDTKI